MYWQPARHPRAGLAIGAVILATWVGAIGVSLATGDAGDGHRGDDAAVVHRPTGNR